MRGQYLLLLVLSASVASQAPAVDFKDALAANKVCERQDGFIQATAGYEAEMAELVKQVNAKRTAVYKKIAAKEGTALDAVALEYAHEQKAENRCK